MPDSSYLDRTNPNLVVTLHYLSKTQWVLLAAFFGYIGLTLYLAGISAPGEATAGFFGVKMTLKNAGPGLVVMVVALLCALVGAVRAKVEMTRDSINLAASLQRVGDELQETQEELKLTRERNSFISIVESFEGAELPGGLSVLEHVWGLTEIAMIRIPISAWASENEHADIRKIQSLENQPEDCENRLTEIARNSQGFRSMLGLIQRHKFEELGFELMPKHEQMMKADFSLPWCVRLRWGARNSELVDLFVCVTAKEGVVDWYTFNQDAS